MGGAADSYYEYLLKQWIQTGKTTDWYVNPSTVNAEAPKTCPPLVTCVTVTQTTSNDLVNDSDVREQQLSCCCR